MQHLFDYDLQDTVEFEQFVKTVELKPNERYVGHMSDGSKCYLKAVKSEDCESCVFHRRCACGLANGTNCSTNGVILIKENI